MKLHLLASAALAGALLAGPVLADPSGYVSADWGRANIDSGFGSGHADVWDAKAALSDSISGTGLGYQFDGTYQNVSAGLPDDYSATAHLFKRDNGMAYGAFVGAARLAGETAYDVGAEVQKYWEKARLSGTATYGYVDGGFGGHANIWAVKGAGDYYVTDNVRLEATTGYTSADTTPHLSFWDAGIEAEYKVPNGPLSLFAGYDYSKPHNLGISHIDAFRVGFRLNFGTGTLKQRDQAGAGMSPGLDTFTKSAVLF